MDEVIEIGEQEDGVKDNNKDKERTSDSKIVSQRYERQGMTLGQKSDIGVCVTMVCFVILSVLITATKIILKYLYHRYINSAVLYQNEESDRIIFISN